MMRSLHTIFFVLIMLSSQLMAQETTFQVSVGTSYANGTFVELDDASTSSYPHTDWDIAFSLGQRDAGVFVNEAVALSFTTPFPPVELYLTLADDFANTDTAGMLRVYNDEVNWLNGAFNANRDRNNPSDFGWGTYNGATRVVEGDRIFAIKLRDGSFKKLEIQKMEGSVYTIRYADLDGNNEQVKTIDKANYAGKTLAYFSLASGNEVDLEPNSWDLLFTRYVTPLSDGNGGVIDYTLTGVLTNSGMSVAQADGIDPATVNHENFADDYVDSLDVIGSDWKQFGMGWSIVADRVYFVKDTDANIWKIQFTDFEGSSSGTTTLKKTLVGSVTTSTKEENEYLTSLNLYPNPVTDFVNVIFEAKETINDAQLTITNQLGQLVLIQDIHARAGLNAQRLPISLAQGVYHLTIQLNQEFITETLLVK